MFAGLCMTVKQPVEGRGKDMITKQQRQRAILEIVERNECCRQEDLLRELRKRGIETTQATISRDIRQIGLIKLQRQPGVYTYVRRTGEELDGTNIPYAEIFGHAVVAVDYAMNTVAIRCRTGMANAACAALDNMRYPAVVGTLAGDDTIFVLMRTEADAKEMTAGLLPLIR